jgi:hypothetical protein
MMEMLKIAALFGLIAPFVIVGVGVVLGLTLAITQTMLGMVLGMIEMFHPNSEE